MSHIIIRMHKVKDECHQLSHAKSALYLGRGTLYPLALEGALKLKELSYIHAGGIETGETCGDGKQRPHRKSWF